MAQAPGMGGGGDFIATRAVGIFPALTRGFDKQLGAQLTSGAVASQASNAGRSLGSRLGSSITSTLKTGLKIGGVVTGAIGAVTLKGGLDRALGIEDAQAKMKGLGYDTKATSKIMDNALASVEGTSFGLDEAATTAASAVAAGIKPGKELEGVLTTVANTSAGAGTSMSEMGAIFSTVAANGKAYTGDIKMVADRGIPIWQSLGKNLGKTTAEVQKMASEGKISFKDFEAAAADASGEVAAAMGNTTRGSLKNMYAAVKKLGAMFVTGLLPMAKTTFQGIQGLLNAVKDKLQPFVEGFFDKFGGKANAGIKSFFDGLISRVESFDPTPVANFFKEVSGGLKAFAASWKYNDGEVTSSGFPGFMEKAAYWLHQFWDALKGMNFSGIGKTFAALGSSLKGIELPSGNASGGALAGIGDSLKAIGGAAPGVIALGLDLLGRALQFISDHAGTIVKFMPLIVAGLVAWKVHSVATTDALIAQRIMTAKMAPVMLANNAAILANNLLEGRSARAKVASTVATKVQEAATKKATIATRIFGIAQKIAMGPIGWVIAGITLLIAGLVLFFTKTKLGQAIWAKVWGGIKAATAAVVSWFQNSALPVLQAAWQGIAAGATWLYRNVILPVWSGIRAAISVVASWITGTLVPALAKAWQGIASVATWLYRNIISPIWTGIKIAIAVVIFLVISYVKMWVAIFKNVLAPVFVWLYQKIIQPAWAGIRAAISAVVSWFQNTAWPLLSKVVGWISDKFTKFKRGLAIIWAYIKATVVAPVVRWFQSTVLPAFRNAVQSIQDKFTAFKRGLAIIWGAVRSKVIGPVASWFQKNVVSTFSNAISSVRSKFQGLKDKLSDIWSAIKNKVVAPVANWFTDTVKPKVNTFVDNLKTGFTGLKDSIVETWKKIKDAVKKPINGVIDIYNKHVKTPFNTVINTILGGGSRAAKALQLPEMPGFATGGYTGSGSKYQPAGVVHADEYVIRKESQNGIERQAPGFLDALNTHGPRALTAMGLGYASGGKVLHGWREIAGIPHKGMAVTSTVRRGARTAGTGSVSKHATGYAVDFAGTAQAMKDFFNYVRANYKVSELIHTRMGGKQLSRGGIPKAKFPSKTAAMHLNHVHVGGYAPGEKQGAGTSGAAGTDNPFTGMWSKIKDTVAEKVGGGALGGMLSGLTKNVISNASSVVEKKIMEVAEDTGSWGATSGASVGTMKKYNEIATQALEMTGNFSEGNLKSLMRRMAQESSYNPNAVNKTDSNAAKGTPSKGLMQVIDPTFKAYAMPGYDKNIFDPLSNILASIRYTKARYGSLTKGWNQTGGYAGGGWTGPGSKWTPAGTVHADEFVVQKSSRRSIERERPGFLDRLNRHGAAALGGYANGGLVGYAGGGKVDPLSKIGSTKVSVIVDGLTGTQKQVETAAGKLADGIVKVFNDRMKTAKTTTVNKLSDSLASLKKQASALKKTVSTTTSKSKKTVVNNLSDQLAGLRKQAKSLTATSKEVQKITTVTGKTKTGKLITKTSKVATSDAKKAAKSLAAVNKQIETTQTALTRARRGDYSGAASKATAQLKSVEKQIAATDKALKAARRGDYTSAALIKGTAAYNKYAASAVDRLSSYAEKADDLTARLKSANTQLADAQKLLSDYKTSMVEKFQGTYALSEESATTGIETIIRGFKNGATTVKTFTNQLSQLKGKGLSAGLVDQIAQMGAESGSKVAKNLLTGSSSQIKEITKQYNALNSASTTSGTSLANQMYKSGVDSAKGLVKGLESQLSNVEKMSETLANKVIKTVKKTLKIKSPSRVMRSLGGFTVDGFRLAVESGTAGVQSALMSMVEAPDVAANRTSRGSSSLAMPSTARTGSNGSVAGRGSAPLIGSAVVHGYSVEEVADAFDRKIRKREALYS